MLSLENESIRVWVNECGSLSVCRKEDEMIWEQGPSNLPAADWKQQGDCLAAVVQGPDFALSAEVRLVSACEFELRLSAPEDALMHGNVEWPPAWRPQRGDRAILPLGEGYSFPVEDDTLNVPPEMFFYCGATASLCLYGLERGQEGCLMVGVEDGSEASILNGRGADGFLETRQVWKSSWNTWNYDKALRFFVCKSLSEAAGLYRKWRESRGEVVTLRQKMKHLPSVAKLAGAADLWLWDENTMNRLYARPEESALPPRIVKDIVADLLDLGMDHILWNSFEGETPEDCNYLTERGFLVGKYDNYRDVIPKPDLEAIIPYRRKRSVNSKYWPQIVSIDENGNPGVAWALHGLDGKMHNQHAVCEIPALRLTMENVTAELEHVPYTSRFIDVQAGMFLQECHSPLHPARRRDSLRYIRHQLDFLADIGLVNGVEVGSEATAMSYHFSEGMFSPVDYRAPNAGRRMTTQYADDDVPESLVKYMLNPQLRIPLWDLVYHDCTVNYWYWGDSTNSCPCYMKRRDLLDIVCAQPPIYSLNVEQWRAQKQDIAASYHRTSPVAKAAFAERMTDFRILSDDRMVQRSTFENGVQITVNFGNTPFTLENGTQLPPEGFVMGRMALT